MTRLSKTRGYICIADAYGTKLTEVLLKYPHRRPWYWLSCCKAQRLHVKLGDVHLLFMVHSCRTGQLCLSALHSHQSKLAITCSMCSVLHDLYQISIIQRHLLS